MRIPRLNLLFAATTLTCLLETAVLARQRAQVETLPPDSQNAEQAGALRLAKSVLPSDHEVLRKQLLDPAFLKRLDSPEAYRGAPGSLHLKQVLDVLSTNQAPSAHPVLVALVEAESFGKDTVRAGLLIPACAAIRPPPPAVVKFWDDHCQPDDGFEHHTIEAIVQNGTAPALRLLEKKMASRSFDDEDKRAWMLSSILTHRNDVLLLETCGRLLKGILPEALRPTLVDALFDYRPQEWFTPDTVLRPPDPRQASAEARRQLRNIGVWALHNLHLTDRQKVAINSSLKRLESSLGTTERARCAVIAQS